MMGELSALRSQILANGRLLLETRFTSQHGLTDEIHQRADSPHGIKDFPEMNVVVFGAEAKYVAAIMVNLKPAIEGPTSTTPEVAIRRLLLATSELLDRYMPKLGSHQKSIHGGGIYDEDMISSKLTFEPAKKI